MPDPEIRELPSIWGYINWRELRTIVITSNIAQAALELVILPILQNHSLWLAEPWNSRLSPVFALAIALITGRMLGKRMIRQGE